MYKTLKVIYRRVPIYYEEFDFKDHKQYEYIFKQSRNKTILIRKICKIKNKYTLNSRKKKDSFKY